MRKETTIRVSCSVHDALVHFGQSQQLCMSDAIAELLARSGQNVNKRLTSKRLGRPPKFLNDK